MHCIYCGNPAEFQLGLSTVEFQMGANPCACAEHLAQAVRDYHTTAADPCAVKSIAA